MLLPVSVVVPAATVRLPVPVITPEFVPVAFSVNVVAPPVRVTPPAPTIAAMLSDPVSAVVPALVIVAPVPNAPPSDVSVAPANVSISVEAVVPLAL